MTEHPAMTIISGCPGSGKTTIAKALAKRWQAAGARPLRLDSDVFFTFPEVTIRPDLPQSKAQNEVIAAAIASSAMSFVEGGYNVILDGVIGPWMLPHYLKVFKGRLLGLSYVVLRAPFDETRERATTRPDGEKFSPSGVQEMHEQFKDLKVFEPHAFETEGKSVDDTLAELEPLLLDRHFQFEIG